MTEGYCIMRTKGKTNYVIKCNQKETFKIFKKQKGNVVLMK